MSLMVESLLEIITEGRGQKFYKPIDVNSGIYAVDKTEVGMILHVVTLGVDCKQTEGEGHFSWLNNRNYLDLNICRCDRNCCTMENLRHLLCCNGNILMKPRGMARSFFHANVECQLSLSG